MTMTKTLWRSMNTKAIRYFPPNNIYLLKTGTHETVNDAVERFKKYGEVEYAEPNYRRYVTSTTPNDPLFSSQWAHQNIQSTKAWDVTRGTSSVIVAVSDTGIDYTHEDLKNNLWKNNGEDWGGSLPGHNGFDDDNDGYVDNYYGINVITESGDPLDDEGHGTHVSGIIGARANNLKGISGVNWQVSIMALKFIGANGSGSVADEIKTIEFAREKGVSIINMSFGGSFFSQFEMDAIANSGNIIFMAAAGNESTNNDVQPSYPANYDLPNIVSIAASNEADGLAFFSNYGKNTIDLSAPGTNILSTTTGNSYDTLNGTSFSVPYVSGLAALVLSKFPGLSVSQLKDRIMRTVDVNADLQGKTITGGRINAFRALTESVNGPFIYNISPDKGPVNSIVTIRGSNFKDTEGTVLFEGGLEATVVSWSNEKIICKVPSGAITGPVKVKTSKETSNSMDFEITILPSMISYLFSYASTEDGQNSWLVLSNPFDSPVIVNILVIGETQKTLDNLLLAPHKKYIKNLKEYGNLNEKVHLICESDDFFGAIVMSIYGDFKKTIYLKPEIVLNSPFILEEDSIIEDPARR